jgi:transcriptional regulator with XRE-family HTH domain
MVDLGTRLRRIRRQQGRTLEEIAQRCGCTRSLLSKIETGKSSPPIATLTRIAQALGVEMATLLGDTNSNSVTYTPAGNDSGLTITDKGYQFQALAGTPSGGRMQVYLFVARKGEVKPGELHHPGEEFVHVLSGSMRYRVGKREFHLSAGDSLHFDAGEDHDLEPISDEVRYLAVFVDRDGSRA